MSSAASSRRLVGPVAPILVALVLTLGGCRERSPAADTPPPSSPSHGGTLVVGASADPGGVNELIVPGSSFTDEILFQMFLHLLEEQPDFTQHPPTFVPQLAESYTWSSDHKVLTFHLRQDITWSDGVPVTAEDVRWTWQAETDPSVAWDAAYMKDDIDDVEVVDPHTVQFHFKRVSPSQLLHANEGVILPKHAWGTLPFSQWRTNDGWFRTHLVVDGPFTLGSWDPNQEFQLMRNESYYRQGYPLLDRVVFRIIPDQSNQLTQILRGRLDYLIGLDPEAADRVKESDDVRLLAFWHRLFVFISWNTRSPLFSDVRVRQALTQSINRQSIIESLWGGYARIATSPVVSNVWAHNAKIQPWPYDPARAAQLLAAAGWSDHDGDGVLDKDGHPFSFELYTHTGNRERQDATVMIQEQLRRVKIDARPRILDYNTFVDLVDQGSLDAFLVGLGMATDIDPSYLLASDGSMNYARYSNPDLDRLLAEANRQIDPADAKPQYDRIQEIIHRDQPYTFLWESQRLNAARRRVHEVQPNLLFNLFHLEEWWVEPER